MALPMFIVKIKSGLKTFMYHPEIYLYKCLKSILFIFVMILAILVIPVLIGSDYESILRIDEFGIISSGTLAILTFSYAHEKKGHETYDKLVRSGELLFQCSVTLIIGLGLLPQVGYLLRNHAAVSSPFGMFAGVYDGFLALVVFFIMIVGIFSLLFSALFLMPGIGGLIEVFEKNSLND
jgi:hypothetical protein